MAHPDFRVAGKIFATLRYPEAGWGMVKLSPDEQDFFVQAAPEIFIPVKGAWGKRGATTVRLEIVSKDALRDAMSAAWRGNAPRRLLKESVKAKR